MKSNSTKERKGKTKEKLKAAKSGRKDKKKMMRERIRKVKRNEEEDTAKGSYFFILLFPYLST